MKNFVVPALLLLLFSCKDPKKVKYDWDANHFYADYVKIYDGYGVKPYDSTKLALQQFLKQFPNDAKAWAFYGKILLEHDSTEAARAAYVKVIQYDSLMSWGYFGLGVIANMEQHYLQADSFLRIARKMGDTSLLLSLNLATANVMQKQGTEGRPFIEAIAKKDSLDDFMKEHLAVLFTELNDKADADKWTQKVLAPDSFFKQYEAGEISAAAFFNAKKHAYDGRK
ncbi:MAG: hypothetical protein U0T73_01965 [Chitinophagales bacterium]